MTSESKVVASTQEEPPRPMSGPEMIERAVKGFQAYEQGRYEEARAVFVELAAREPTEGYYRTALGAICLAVDELDEALRLNPQDCPALVNRGEVHLRLGNIMQGAKDFARVVALDPEHKDPLTERARLLAVAALQSIEEAQLEAVGGGSEG